MLTQSRGNVVLADGHGLKKQTPQACPEISGGLPAALVTDEKRTCCAKDCVEKIIGVPTMQIVLAHRSRWRASGTEERDRAIHSLRLQGVLAKICLCLRDVGRQITVWSCSNKTSRTIELTRSGRV